MQYRDAFAGGLLDAAMGNSDVMLVESDIPSPARHTFRELYPKRFINTGIAEANAVGICAGLASDGYVPYWYTYGFLIGRTYNQIKQSIAVDKMNVKIYGYNCGVSGIGGSSHNCVEDIGILRTIPNMTIIAPADAYETYQTVRAVYEHDGPTYVRFPRGEDSPLPRHMPFEIGKGTVVKSGSDLTIIANGPMVSECLEAVYELPFNVEVINMSTVKPLDYGLILESAEKTGLVITAEEHYVVGGLGEAVSSFLSSAYPCPVYHIGVEDVFTQSGKGDLKDKYCLTSKYVKWLCEHVMEDEEQHES
jgi:transketolase